MIKDTTLNNLVLLAYNELPENQAIDLINRMEENTELKKEFLAIKNNMSSLNSAMCSPHPTSVQIVLEESCSASPLEMI